MFAARMLGKEVKVIDYETLIDPIEKLKASKEALVAAMELSEPEEIQAIYNEQEKFLVKLESFQAKETDQVQSEFLERFLAEDNQVMRNLKDFIKAESKERIFEVCTKSIQLMEHKNKQERELNQRREERI